MGPKTIPERHGIRLSHWTTESGAVHANSLRGGKLQALNRMWSSRGGACGSTDDARSFRGGEGGGEADRDDNDDEEEEEGDDDDELSDISDMLSSKPVLGDKEAVTSSLMDRETHAVISCRHDTTCV